MPKNLDCGPKLEFEKTNLDQFRDKNSILDISISKSSVDLIDLERSISGHKLEIFSIQPHFPFLILVFVKLVIVQALVLTHQMRELAPEPPVLVLVLMVT